MKSIIPTDRFGRAIETPSFDSSSGPVINYDEKFINTEGDTLEGELDMGKFKITNLGIPIKVTDATNKKYVDDLFEKRKKEVDKKMKDKHQEIGLKIIKSHELIGKNKRITALNSILLPFTKRTFFSRRNIINDF